MKDGAAEPIGARLDPLALQVLVYTSRCTFLVVRLMPAPRINRSLKWRLNTLSNWRPA